MTSELKPDYEKFAREICQFAFEGCDADGGSIQEIGVKYGVLKAEPFSHEKHTDVVNGEDFEEGDTIYCFAPSPATPSADPRAGLVRYSVPDRYDKVMPDGEYVLHSDVDKIIEALDNRACIAEYRFENAINFVQPLLMRRAETAEAELAQIKAQEPVGYALIMGETISFSTTPTKGHQPLYAAPVSDSLKVENEQLREALEVALLDLKAWVKCSKDNNLGALTSTPHVIDHIIATLNVEASNDKG